MEYDSYCVVKEVMEGVEKTWKSSLSREYLVLKTRLWGDETWEVQKGV